MPGIKKATIRTLARHRMAERYPGDVYSSITTFLIVKSNFDNTDPSATNKMVNNYIILRKNGQFNIPGPITKPIP